LGELGVFHGPQTDDPGDAVFFLRRKGDRFLFFVTFAFIDEGARAADRFLQDFDQSNVLAGPGFEGLAVFP
jgi:hypothetical protein